MSKKSGIFVLAALLWGLFIFFNSLQTGEVSTQMSDAVVFRLPDWLRWIDLDTLIMLVRKTAHFMEYALLSLLVSLSFFHSGGLRPRNIGNILFPCLLWAVADEFIQTFVEGRTGLVRDVLIDFGGVLFGLILTALLVWVRRRWKKRKRSFKW